MSAGTGCRTRHTWPNSENHGRSMINFKKKSRQWRCKNKHEMCMYWFNLHKHVDDDNFGGLLMPMLVLLMPVLVLNDIVLSYTKYVLKLCTWAIEHIARHSKSKARNIFEHQATKRDAQWAHQWTRADTYTQKSHSNRQCKAESKEANTTRKTSVVQAIVNAKQQTKDQNTISKVQLHDQIRERRAKQIMQFPHANIKREQIINSNALCMNQ